MNHRLSPPHAARRNVLHFIVLGWYEVLLEAAAASARFKVFTSPRGRRQMFEYNQATSKRLDLMHSEQFPLVKYRMEDPPGNPARILTSLVRDALYVSHTGRLPGTNRQTRDSLLRKWGYLRAKGI